ncbi:hypothetical protein C8Q74DRAFT_1231656 [Fomes fomentarius]|nr:hypothetical protein C8Q74DRAFT_1231656 [Fomes fomentarius]
MHSSRSILATRRDMYPSSLPTSSSILPSLSPIPPLDDSFGAILVSTFVALLLYGLTVRQNYQYFCSYPADSSTLKLIVLSLLLGNTVDCGALIYTCYHYLVVDYANPLDLNRIVWSFKMTVPVVGIMLLVTQSFHLRRICIAFAQHRRLLSTSVLSLMLVETGLLIAFSVKLFKTKDFFQVDIATTRLASVLFGLTVAIDGSLTGLLIIILRRRRSGFRHTNEVLDKLTWNAVIATALNGAVILPAFVFVVAQPHNFIWVAIIIPAPEVYTNSILAVLNCRDSTVIAVDQGAPVIHLIDIAAEPHVLGNVPSSSTLITDQPASLAAK